jgi:hypothetical protein
VDAKIEPLTADERNLAKEQALGEPGHKTSRGQQDTGGGISVEKREVLITNLEEREMAMFPELYYKRRLIETKYNQMKQKFELENSSGRDHIL